MCVCAYMCVCMHVCLCVHACQYVNVRLVIVDTAGSVVDDNTLYNSSNVFCPP